MARCAAYAVQGLPSDSDLRRQQHAGGTSLAACTQSSSFETDTPFLWPGGAYSDAERPHPARDWVHIACRLASEDLGLTDAAVRYEIDEWGTSNPLGAPAGRVHLALTDRDGAALTVTYVLMPGANRLAGVPGGLPVAKRIGDDGPILCPGWP